MKALITLAVVAALSQPLAAMAADTPSIPSSQAATMAKNTETDAIVSKPSQNRTLSTFQVPKALTAQQINDSFELEYDKLFNVTPGFHSP